MKEVTLIIIKLFLLSCFSLTIGVSQLYAADMRELNLQAEADKQRLFEQAAREKEEAAKLAAESRAQILQDRSRLEKAIAEMKQRKETLEIDIGNLETKKDALATEEAQVIEELAQTSQMINELVGLVRVNAKDIDSLLSNNQQTAMLLKYPVFLGELAGEDSFPGMDNIRGLAEVLFQQIETTGQVTRQSGEIVDRNGKSVTAEILMLGPFTAIYSVGDEIGFLRYSPAGRKLYALSKLPSRRMQKQLRSYLAGDSESITMDIGRGAALEQLRYRLNLREQVEQGGPIVWPILAILVVGLFIVFERTIFLFRKHCNSDGFMRNLAEAAQEKNWQECDSFCRRFLKKPVARVIHAGLQSRQLEREEMENVLQEAILREIPPMERFLSTLGMLAAIAPLLGLLGTVTGMIDTFHVITLHGTSDPRLMSGGISEALVTTMLGLGVAIPLMLAQTLLNRSVEKEIGTMEEKAVALINIIHKSRIV